MRAITPEPFPVEYPGGEASLQYMSHDPVAFGMENRPSEQSTDLHEVVGEGMSFDGRLTVDALHLRNHPPRLAEVASPACLLSRSRLNLI